MKTKIYITLTAILFPVIMHAQVLFNQGGKVHYKQQSMQSVSKNSSQVLFTSALSGYYREDFEGAFPPAGWQVIDALNPAYTWQTSTQTPFNGVKSAMITYDLANNPGEDWLILPQFTVTAVDSFSFQLALQDTGWIPDSTFILISTTDSALTSFTSVIATLAEGDNYPAVRSVYQKYSYALAAFAGSDIYVAIKNKNTNGDGVFIDKVEIGTKPAEATPVSIDMNKVLPIGTTISPTATVLNDGYITQSFPVTMTITGGYTSVKNVTNLVPGATQQITFDPWTAPVVPGTEMVSVQTQLTGDVYPADDSLAAAIKILEPFTNYGWTSKAPVSPIKWGVPLASINTNDTSYLFTMGGNVGGNPYSSSARKYLPYSNSWATLPNMPVSCAYAAGASYNNQVYVVSGMSSYPVLTNANRIYNLVTNSWSLGAAIPNSTSYYVLGVYHDSLFYYIGGSNLINWLNYVQIYNAASDTWSVGTHLPVAVGAAGGGISGNKIVVAGGISDTYLGVIDPSDPTIITWSIGDHYPVEQCLGLAGGASLDESSGLIVFTGGALNNSVPGISSEYTLAYDVNANQWKIGPPKPTPANNLTNLAAVVNNDSLYMVSVGGWTTTTAVNVNEWLNMGPYVIPTGVADNNPISSSFTCYPNPFVNVTDIKFSLPRTSAVKAVIVDMVGQEVEVLCNKNLQSGNQHLQWNAAKYTNGIYFCRLTVNGIPTTQKLVKY